ncbi:MAG: DUF2939 domain-containing protein [Brevundimonas sp.]|uniref:DUF2939 domain-containing protein n=1 Tax=Brevundimonas sp. TaxID=1871086 RepID=UPI0025BDE9CA|nr:DUF2939 domain-containing protein [Brevundimonas sp.]MBX3478262.1 DUF2939 domain-containing protein [Brevundimonas sp.]
MGRLLFNLVLTAIVVAVISFFAAPGVAFFAIRSAGDANDAAALSRLVDFGAVRQSLRPQMGGDPRAFQPAPSFLEDPIGAVRRQLEQNPAVRPPDVEAYLTPRALAALTRGEGRLASQRSAPGAEPAMGGPLPSPVYWGVNGARMAVADEGGSRTVFTFARKGPFEWKLVHVGLPEGVAPPTPAPRPAAAPAG